MADVLAAESFFQVWSAMTQAGRAAVMSPFLKTFLDTGHFEVVINLIFFIFLFFSNSA
jgi:hypothetical protein